MATTRGTERKLPDMVQNLIQLDFDAIQAYDAAIARVEDPGVKEQLAAFRADHERHTRELGELMPMLGGEAPEGGDLKGLLTKGKVVLSARGGDAAILAAMKTNEDDTNQAYDQALAREDIRERDELLRVLRGGQADERRHREGIVAALRRLDDAAREQARRAK